jgi:hypothetical protein
MAIGDYVRTLAGVIARGGQAIAAAIFGRGGSGSEAAAALRATFPSLPGNLLGGFVRGVQQQVAAGQTQFQGGALAGTNVLQIVAPGNIGPAQRVLIEATVTGDQGTEAVSQHWVDLEPGQTLEDAADIVKGRLALVFLGTDSPELADELEGEEPAEVTTRVKTIQIRSGG